MAKAESSELSLYDKYCPNDASKVVSLDWQDFSQFDINVFRIGQSPSLTFQCTVAVYPDVDRLPATCDSRRRRDVTSLFNQPKKSKAIDVTVNLSDLAEDKSAATPLTCASTMIVPFIFQNFLPF